MNAIHQVVVDTSGRANHTTVDPINGGCDYDDDDDGSNKKDVDDEKNEEEDTEVVDLTVPWLSKFFMEVFDMEKVPFHLEGETDESLLTALSEKIAQEIQSVEGYVSTWRASGVMGAVPAKNMEVDTHDHVKAQVFPWPQIQEQPTKERADGRFVKAFPLVFPMGVADPRHPRLRSDYSFIDAVQHLFRYRTGHFLN